MPFPEAHTLVLEAETQLKEKALKQQCIHSSTPIHSKVVLLCPKRVGVAEKCIQKKSLGLSLKG